MVNRLPLRQYVQDALLPPLGERQRREVSEAADVKAWGILNRWGRRGVLPTHVFGEALRRRLTGEVLEGVVRQRGGGAGGRRVRGGGPARGAAAGEG